MARYIKAHDIAGITIVLGVALFLVVTILKTYSMAFGFIFPMISREIVQDTLERNGTVAPTTLIEHKTITVEPSLNELTPATVTMFSTEVVTSVMVATKTGTCSPTPTVHSYISAWSQPVVLVHDSTDAEISVMTFTMTTSITDVVCAPASATSHGHRPSLITLYIPRPAETAREDESKIA